MSCLKLFLPYHSPEDFIFQLPLEEIYVETLAFIFTIYRELIFVYNINTAQNSFFSHMDILCWWFLRKIK